MRNELETIQLIEHYLLGKLTEKQNEAFEEKMKTDQEFKNLVEKHRLLQEGIQRNALKNEVSKAKSKFKTMRFWKIASIAIVVAGVITTGILLLNKQGVFNSNNSNNTSTNLKYEFNEDGTTTWIDADKNLKSQFFQINNKLDTILITESGLVVAIPQGAIVDSNGNAIDNAEIEIKEAINPEEIIGAGLSTFAGDDLLETGGMFFINARKDGQNLQIAKGKRITADVPTNEVKPNMLLFDGKRKLNGQIDWVNPKPMEQFLNTVDIKKLDFFPRIYEPRLAELGHQDKPKKWKDSLYFSYGYNHSAETEQENGSNTKQDEKRSYNPQTVDKIKKLVANDQFQVRNNTYFIGATRIDNQSFVYVKLFGEHIYTSKDESISEGPLISSFSQNKKLKVSDYFGFKNLHDEYFGWSTKSSNDLAIFRIEDSEVSGKIDMGFMLCNNSRCLVLNNKLTIPPKVQIVNDTIVDFAPTSPKNQINPSKIEAIWNQKFNKTLLATKEFEERLIYLHQACRDDLLELYVNNLDQRMATIDSLVAKELCRDCPPNQSQFQRAENRGNVPARRLTAEESHFLYGPNKAIVNLMSEEEAIRLSKSSICPVDLIGFRRVVNASNINFENDYKSKKLPAETLCKKFQEFASQNKGRVNNQDANTKMLSKFYERQYRKFAKKARSIQDELTKKYKKLQEEKSTSNQNALKRNMQISTENLAEEINLNMKEAYRQLGKKMPTPRNSYRAPVQTFGWKNVDRYVYESTINRKTLDFTDEDGKKAVIKYEKCAFDVKNAKEYDKVYVYLVPGSLQSYMRLSKRKGNVFTENLNELMEYGALVYAQKGEEQFLWKKNFIEPKEYTVELKSISKKDLKKELRAMTQFKSAKTLVQEIKERQHVQSIAIEEAKMRDAKEFREMIKYGVWYCYTPEFYSSSSNEDINIRESEKPSPF